MLEMQGHLEHTRDRAVKPSHVLDIGWPRRRIQICGVRRSEKSPFFDVFDVETGEQVGTYDHRKRTYSWETEPKPPGFVLTKIREAKECQTNKQQGSQLW